ncbi:MAG TPA: exodeoxyribonuclease VII small subunit [Firmicutes bacterium]|nr:exodeoxyribonuclease VII small subunit [Bacillota bacterium]
MAGQAAGRNGLRRILSLTREKQIKNLTYEEAVKKLEEIVEQMEDSEIPLEESLAYFQEGIALSRYCREKLAEIENRVEYLLKEERQQSGGGPEQDSSEE